MRDRNENDSGFMKKWPLVAVACLCNVLEVIGQHYLSYVRYVFRRPNDPIPSLALEFREQDLILLAPIAIVLLFRNVVPIVASYAVILLLILIARIYLLLPESWTGYDAPSMPLDGPSIVLYFLGYVSGLFALIALPVFLALHVIQRSKRQRENK